MDKQMRDKASEHDDLSPKSVRLKRIALAALPALLYLMVLIPNTGRIVAGTSTTPPSYSIVDRPKQIALVIWMLLIPLCCILVPVRKPIIQGLGWLLLWGLVILAFTKGT